MNTLPQAPFAPVLEPHTASLPPAFARQFLQTTPIRLAGTMHRVWHKPVLRPMFWVLGRLGILVGKVGKDIPTTLALEITEKGQLWHRNLHFTPPIRFNSLNTYDPKIECVMEWIGPGHALGMVWQIDFHPPQKLTLITTGWVLRLGNATLPVPNWFWPWTLGTAYTIQHADENDENTIHIELIICHKLLGEMFGYSGTFQIAHTSF